MLLMLLYNYRIIAVLRHDPSEEKLLYVANIAFQVPE